MSYDQLAGLLGGIGLFLLGMALMTEGLKQAAGNALRDILGSVTRGRLRALGAGFSVTALVQSSSAVTVAAIGFVNAGLLSLGGAIWVVFGANLGTTMTSWLVSLLGVNLRIEALALPAIGLGALLRLLFPGGRRGAVGEALAGFGLFFLGIALLKDAFSGLAGSLDLAGLADGGVFGALAFVGFGFLVTLLTQSSSASIAIAITAAAGGLLGLESAAAMVIGANLGTTSTAVFAALGATPNAKRVAAAHVSFNLLVGAVALAVLPLLLALVTALGEDLHLPGQSTTAVTLALFHSLVKLLGVLLMWPLGDPLVRWLQHRFVTAEEDEGRSRHLDPTTLQVPSLALESLVLELRRLGAIAVAMAGAALGESPPTPRRLAERRAALEALAAAVGDYLHRLETVRLTPQQAEALPHALRLAQHYREVGRLAVGLAEARLSDPAPAGPLQEPLEDYRRSIANSLRLPEPDEVGDWGEPPAETAARIEAGYQKLKARLLRTAAQGELDPLALDRLMGVIGQQRRCGEYSAKARLRFQRIRDALEGRKAGPEAPESLLHED